ncbi:hypothetical protein CYLTODRAFT_422108 [Cylindrobasidium torrendii FP15055 ss-10]|uniref:Uncharacterized protein n=1 Tax=Cylindrobasidium torrendii FP15055 ss-10 TaxID=1314674 RepID=A0A0D7BCC3_9AGAR|nr:hypothetical protein CYLTODRAFT_422108 [Cylindrobasidium torrendii FP15055 ss-10]
MLDLEASVRPKKCRIDYTDDSARGTNTQPVDLESTEQLFDSIENNMKEIFEQWEAEKAALIAVIEDLKQTNAALKDEVKAQEYTIYTRDVHIRKLEKELIEDKQTAVKAEKDCDSLREK